MGAFIPSKFRRRPLNITSAAFFLAAANVGCVGKNGQQFGPKNYGENLPLLSRKFVAFFPAT